MRRLLAGFVLVTVGLLLSPSAVPVYDGVGAPDEPYRYVGRATPAVPASSSTTVVGGQSASLLVKSVEQGPQVLLDLAPGAFSATTPRLTVTATPLAGDGEAVEQGTIDGNVYRLTATPGATLTPERALGFLFLRAAVMTSPDPVVVHRTAPTGAWTSVRTVRAGQDILSTPFRELGDYAVVRLPGSKALAASSGLSTGRLFLLVGGVVVLLLLTVVVLRRKPPA
jgi:hypothetical protein